MTEHGDTESKKNKKQESDQTVLTTRKRSPKRLIVLAKPKKWRGTTKKISGALRLTCASQLLNSFQRRWIGLHRHHRRLVHKTAIDSDIFVTMTKTNTESKCNSITITNTQTKTKKQYENYINTQISENYMKTKMKTNLIIKQIKKI